MKHESKYMVDRRERMLGLKAAPEKKKQQPIAKKSAKMKQEMKLYIPAAKEFLNKPENQDCQIKMKGCTGRATVVHHSAGRIGHKLHDQADWIPSCQICNSLVEVNDLLARDAGFKKSQHKI